MKALNLAHYSMTRNMTDYQKHANEALYTFKELKNEHFQMKS